MKKVLTAFVLSLLVLSTTGCMSVTPPNQQQINGANYGELPADYQDQIKNAMVTLLKDPYSAQYSFLTPFKGYSQDGSMASTKGGVSYGWVAPVMINAKNSYGGYVGAKKYVFIFADGQLFDTTLNDMYGRVFPVQ